MDIYTRTVGDGWQTIYRFKNGRGLSVVNHESSYTSSEDECEIAVIRWEHKDWGIKEFSLDYSTKITNDVLGHVNQAEVPKYIDKVRRLKSVWT